MSDLDDTLLETLQTRLGYRFADRARLELALTHKSWANEHSPAREHNERLEFLGDAVLALVVGDLLMLRYPGWDEGRLSKARSALVSEPALAELAWELALGPALRLGRGEAQTGGREKASILSDTVEAIVGAIYGDGGFEPARRVLSALLGPRIAGAAERLAERDPKTELQERLQAVAKRRPRYVLRETSGPEHALLFTVAVEVGGKELAVGMGKSKKEAEQDAAARVLRTLREGGSIRDLVEPSA